MRPALLGCASRKLGVDAELARLVENGPFGHIELRVEDVERDAPAFAPTRLAELERLGHDLGVSFSVHALSGVNLGEKIGRIRRACVDVVREQLDAAERLGARWLTLHLGTCGFGQSEPDKKRARLDLAIESVQALLEVTRGYQVRLGLENLRRLPIGVEKCYLGDSLADFEYLLARLPNDRVGVIFDVGHANIDPELPIVGFMSAVRLRTLAYHVHWNDGLRDQHAALPDAWRRTHQELHNELMAQGERGSTMIIENFDVEALERSARALGFQPREGA